VFDLTEEYSNPPLAKEYSEEAKKEVFPKPENRASYMIYFRMEHSMYADAIQCPNGNMKLIDVKKEIAQRKGLSNGLDFDLKITDADEEDEEIGLYEGDDTLVPGKSALVVKRMPVAPGTGLMKHLKGETPKIGFTFGPRREEPQPGSGYICARCGKTDDHFLHKCPEAAKSAGSGDVPTNPAYSPTSPAYAPTHPAYSPTSPTNPAYSPGTLKTEMKTETSEEK